MAHPRILIVGLGSIGRRHLGLARQLVPGADIRVLRHAPTADDAELGVPAFYDLAEAVAFGPGFAVIANPAPFHLATALSLARPATRLLVEKPLAVSAEGVEALLATCRCRGSSLKVGYHLRFLSSLRRFRELIAMGGIGRVVAVRAEVGQYLPSWRKGVDYRRGVSAQRSLGGGVLLELSHEIDYLRWVFGEITWVTASLGQVSDLDLDVEDTALLQLGFRAPADGRAMIASLAMDFVRHDTTRTCTAIGEAGSLRWNAIAGIVEAFSPAEGVWQEVFRQPPGDDAYAAEWRDFLADASAVSDAATGEDGAAVLRLVDAARLSSARGTRVEV